MRPADLPLSLYVHFPWCASKCPYCDFNSHALRGELPEKAYAAALFKDLDIELARSEQRPLVSVFIGGGTPSLIAPEIIEQLLLRMRPRLAPNAEITLEANPGSVEAGRFAAYRAAGINRLSVGVQSFNDDSLRALGRVHDATEARAAVDTALDTGFDRVNLDLMYALPGQTTEMACQDARIACQLETGHVSHYQLTLEPGTTFFKSPPKLPDDDVAWKMQRECARIFASSAYRHYEISALAQPGHRCRHNLNYWLFGDYLGIGAGAHGKLTTDQGIVRRHKTKSPALYMKAMQTAGIDADGDRQVGQQDALFEFMLNALRLGHGFSRELFEARTGQPFSVVAQASRPAVERGLLQIDDDWCRATPLGRRFLDDLQASFLPASQSSVA
ncbi:MAG: radical SAM family heme chaperone HemW [Gammaproteobacteria bacterium]|nr:radical SAM family heme chaperone HemW [Gammaproteobacteria bacterium]